MNEQYRRCRTCKQVHAIDFFHSYRDARYKREYISWKCRGCWTAYRKHKYHTDENHRRNIRNSELKIEFGITLEEYEELAAYQSHVCAICNEPCSRGIALAVDHDHKTGEIRGLLCCRCNRVLGQMNDSPELFRRAADYLEGK